MECILSQQIKEYKVKGSAGKGGNDDLKKNCLVIGSMTSHIYDEAGYFFQAFY